MNEAASLAGFFAAHAIWCLSDGDTLVPILALETPQGRREMRRLESDELQKSVEVGRGWLARNPESVARAVLLYDGFIPLPSGKTDAVMVEGSSYEPSRWSFTMAIPYRHANRPGGFAVHRPKFLAFDGATPDLESLGTEFFSGVGKHEQGSAIWNKALDETI